MALESRRGNIPTQCQMALEYYLVELVGGHHHMSILLVYLYGTGSEDRNLLLLARKAG